MKYLPLLISLVLFLGLSSGFQSEQGSGDSGVGSTGVQCWNNVDDDNDGDAPPGANPSSAPRTDYNIDAGCANPYWDDDNEGAIWDSHFTATMESQTSSSSGQSSWSPNAESTESLFFQNHVHLGTENNDINDWSDGTSVTDKELNYLDASREESSGLWGFGFREMETIDVQGMDKYNGAYGGQAIFLDSSDVVIDHPSDYNYGVAGSSLDACGNGIEEESVPAAQDISSSTGEGTVQCKADLGDIGQRYDEESPEGTSSASCSCGTSNSGSMHYHQGRTVLGYTAGPDEIYYNYEYCDSIGDCNCGTDADGNTCCCETEYDEDDIGGRTSDCDTHSRVYGGGTSDTQPGSVVNDNRIGNDPAATYTEFTAYDNGAEVWCGYEYAVTVNADGPDGAGNGFVVINEREGSGLNAVMGRESMAGTDQVGRNLYWGVRNADGSDGSATNQESYDFLADQVDLSCPNDKEVCIKYVGFHVETSGWTLPANPSGSDFNAAIDTQVETYTADQSYSVCKAINRIAEEHPENKATSLNWGSGEKLVDCNYMQNDKNHAPLPEACGDEINEDLIVSEGPDVNNDKVENWLEQEQACVDWHGSGDFDEGSAGSDRELDSNACVLRGEPYAEGSVVNLASVESGYPYTSEGHQEGRDSPDWAVCLDIGTDSDLKDYGFRYNDRGEDHYGGSWYNLDDDFESQRGTESINSYIDSNTFTAGNVDSSVAGPSANQDEHWIDYYFFENPNPKHDDYNPRGGEKGVSLIADCGPQLTGCGDERNNLRGDIAAPDFHDGSPDDGTYYAPGTDGNGFDNWNRDDDYRPNEANSPPSGLASVFTGRVNKIRSQSSNLEPGHYDWNLLESSFNDDDWVYDTEADASSAVQYALTRDVDWVPDSTGVPYPAGGTGSSPSYITGDGARAGNYKHIDQDATILRGSTLDSTILKHRKAHGNSLAVAASSSNSYGYQAQAAYWIDPDDLLVEWNNGNIDKGYW